MSLDRSLKIKGGLSRRRSVLKRGERLAALYEEGRWKPGESVFGLPKVDATVTPKPLKALVEEETEAAAEPGVPSQDQAATTE